MYITAQGPRLRNDLYCVEWDVKLYYTIPYLLGASLCSGVFVFLSQLLLVAGCVCVANTVPVFYLLESRIREVAYNFTQARSV